MIRYACVVLTICTMASGFQAQPGSDDAARDKDVYAIYSLLMNHPPTAMAQRPRIGISLRQPLCRGRPRSPVCTRLRIARRNSGRCWPISSVSPSSRARFYSPW